MPTNELCMLHHDLIPEKLRLSHGLFVCFPSGLNIADKCSIQLCLSNDMLDKKRIVYGENAAAEHSAQNLFFEGYKTIQKTQRRLVKLSYLPAQHRVVPGRLPKVQRGFHCGDLFVDRNSGIALGLDLGICGEFSQYFSRGEYAPAHNTVAHRNCASQQCFKLLFK